jgi:hypothetical protein
VHNDYSFSPLDAEMRIAAQWVFVNLDRIRPEFGCFVPNCIFDRTLTLKTVS